VTDVTAFHVESGKIRHGDDYVFDQEVGATAYPPKEAIAADPRSRTAQ
jgi:hypothetical protein